MHLKKKKVDKRVIKSPGLQSLKSLGLDTTVQIQDGGESVPLVHVGPGQIQEWGELLI